jgi:hypothetical protein
MNAERSSRTVVDLATEADEPELRRLLRDNPMEGEVRVSLEREPDARLAAAVEGERHATVVARRPDGTLRGMGSRSVFDAFVDGRPCRLGYLSQLRLDRRERRRAGLLRLLAGGYGRLRDLRGTDEPDGTSPISSGIPFDVTTIVADNAAARRLLVAGLPDLPTYVELEPFVTLVAPVPRRRVRRRPPADVKIDRGSAARMAEVVDCLERNRRRCQLAPRFTEAQLLSPLRSRGLAPEDFFLATDGDGGPVIGCLALWDQSSFKQVVVRGYERRLALLRPAINGLAPLLGTPRLPAVGAALPHAYVSHVAVDDDDPEVFATLWAAARDAAAGRFLYLVAGFAERHPFVAVIRRRARAYRSVIYAVCWERGREAAAVLSAIRALDRRRIPHLEVALL